MLQLHRRSIVSGIEYNQMRSASIELAPEISAEWCYYIENSTTLTDYEMFVLMWLLGETFDPAGLSEVSFLNGFDVIVEIGPRLNFETSWGSTARQICRQVGLTKIVRIERSRRFGFKQTFSQDQLTNLVAAIHDRMTEMLYTAPLSSFETGLVPESVQVIPVNSEGISALRAANQRFGLAMDDHDLAAYYDLSVLLLKRDLTAPELFQLGQGNSEHSRHPFFGGKLVIDGVAVDTSLMEIVKAPWRNNPGNSVIAFADDASAIRGGIVLTLVPQNPGLPSPLMLESRVLHPTLEAETHNHPSGIEPYQGAMTGAGGEIRDSHCVGRGGLAVAGSAGYCTANLHIPGFEQPWEANDRRGPINLASPLDAMIRMSSGASDYGNCFGRPLILGHVRTFGMQTPDGPRAWFKPIMYSAGVGMIDDRHIKKGLPEKGMLIVQIGGPAYRIGIGGGSASSLISGENNARLDFNSVQRGDPEMEQRLNRVIRTCVELGDDNPIISAHDLGAGGDSNALPEIINPAGGRIDLRAIPVGDASLSVLEIWGNESQERDALLIWPQSLDQLRQICERENTPCAVVGEITGDGQLVVFDSTDDSTPVNLPLEPILGDVPTKTINLEAIPISLQPLDLPTDLSVEEALERVLRLPSVSSKRFLTNKVDRSVGGLVAQQQCVGPYQTPLSNYAVVAHGFLDHSGTVICHGERPLIGLISPSAQGRMTVGEALTNLMGARITVLNNIRCSGNWMWAGKQPGEGVRICQAAAAAKNMMIRLGMAIDGGKDSLSMASISDDGSETIKAPGQLVFKPYAVMPDISHKVTPDLKAEGNQLLFIDLSGGQARLGGSALAQTYQQLGDNCPDLEDIDLLRRVFNAVQSLIQHGLIVSLHDRSDGGLVVSLIEMAIAGDFGARIELSNFHDTIHALFSEELGVILEVEPANMNSIEEHLASYQVDFRIIGQIGVEGGKLTVVHNDITVLDQPIHLLRRLWEETSSHLEALQANPDCSWREYEVLSDPQIRPDWRLSFVPKVTPQHVLDAVDKPKIAVLREAGTNGDREMAAAFIAAGFEVWDVTMSDLLSEKARLDQFRGLIFPGGFSFGDVLDSAKGWAAVIRFNSILAEQFESFYRRSDTFSLGVCNGAQLMTLLGWVPFNHLSDAQRPRFIENQSGRFESRFVTVEIFPSPSILLREMEGSRLGVWVAHREGQLHVPESRHLDLIHEWSLAPMRFVDQCGRPTTHYPFNPNGSPEGITALCSFDGRHLAMMPHGVDRLFLNWQWPWRPETWATHEASPWLKVAQNAHDWCLRN